MTSAKMTCRVCGKEYEPCRTATRRPNVFHWQEVACSPECGAIYLQRIIESRKPAEESAGGIESAKRGKRSKKDTIAHIEDEATDFEPVSAIAEAEQVEPSLDVVEESE